MTKQKIEKKKVEKLTLKNMKKRHWVGVATVGVALGIMLGNLGGNAPTPKTDAKPVVTKVQEKKPIELGKDKYITAEIKFNGKDYSSERAEVLYLHNIDTEPVDVEISVDGQVWRSKVALAEDRLLPVQLEDLKPGKHKLRLVSTRFGQNVAVVPPIGDFETIEFELK